MGKQNKNLIYITVTTTHSQIPPECDAVKPHYKKHKLNSGKHFWWQNWFQVRPTETRSKNLKASNDTLTPWFMYEIGGENKHSICCFSWPLFRPWSCCLLPTCSHLPFSPHVEFDEPSSKDGQRANEANGHEDAEQDMVQNHRDKFPLLRSLSEGWGTGQARKPCLLQILNVQ